MTEQEKRTIAQRFIHGLGSRDGNALRSIMTEDVVWSLPGQSPMSGEAHGVEEILKRASTLHGFNVNIEIEHVVFGLQDVALHLHNTGRYGGKVLDEHLTTVIHLDGGKIRQLDTFISDIPMLDDYFSQVSTQSSSKKS